MNRIYTYHFWHIPPGENARLQNFADKGKVQKTRKEKIRFFLFNLKNMKSNSKSQPRKFKIDRAHYSKKV